MKKIHILSYLSLGCCVLLSGCAFWQLSDPPMTQLQIREVQTRELDTTDTKLVMKSMMNVLQDEGFIIKNAVMDIGLLSAEKHVDIEDKFVSAFSLYSNPHASWKKQKILEASANLSEFGEKTRVRINFQVKILDNFGRLCSVWSIQDSEYYRDFFNKVRAGVFIQEQDI